MTSFSDQHLTFPAAFSGASLGILFASVELIWFRMISNLTSQLTQWQSESTLVLPGGRLNQRRCFLFIYTQLHGRVILVWLQTRNLQISDYKRVTGIRQTLCNDSKWNPFTGFSGSPVFDRVNSVLLNTVSWKILVSFKRGKLSENCWDDKLKFALIAGVLRFPYSRSGDFFILFWSK